MKHHAKHEVSEAEILNNPIVQHAIAEARESALRQFEQERATNWTRLRMAEIARDAFHAEADDRRRELRGVR